MFSRVAEWTSLSDLMGAGEELLEYGGGSERELGRVMIELI
jgi:hypothetical protein